MNKRTQSNKISSTIIYLLIHNFGVLHSVRCSREVFPPE